MNIKLKKNQTAEIVREHRTFKTEVVAHGAGGCQSTFEPSTAAACPLGVPIVRTDGRYSKAPQATETISKRRVKARHRELGREKVQGSTEGCRGNVPFQYSDRHRAEKKPLGSIVKTQLDV